MGGWYLVDHVLRLEHGATRLWGIQAGNYYPQEVRRGEYWGLVSGRPCPETGAQSDTSVGDTSRELLPTGSEERGVLGVGSIPVAILPSCQYMKILHFNYPDMNIVG